MMTEAINQAAIEYRPAPLPLAADHLRDISHGPLGDAQRPGVLVYVYAIDRETGDNVFWLCRVQRAGRATCDLQRVSDGQEFRRVDRDAVRLVLVG